MKKFFVVVGSIFLVLIVLVAIGIAFIAIRRTALDKESKAYADSAIPAIVTTWSEKELLDRASPEFKKVVTIDQLDGLFRAFATLGPLTEVRAGPGSFADVCHHAERQNDFRSVHGESDVRKRRGHHQAWADQAWRSVADLRFSCRFSSLRAPLKRLTKPCSQSRTGLKKTKDEL